MTEFDFSRIPDAPPSVFVAPLKRPSHVGEDWLELQQRRYDADQHQLWDELFARQLRLLPGRACQAFMDGLERLDLGRGGLPSFERINEALRPLTGWQVVPVPMLIPDALFF